VQEILKEIVQNKRTEVEERKNQFPLSFLQNTLHFLSKPRDFFRALSHHQNGEPKGSTCSLIAEIKKASPSKGLLSNHFDPLGLAKVYEGSGASALSILTDEHYFLGSLQFIPLVKINCPLPILQKDFIIDEYQIFEARRWGADAILLIASVLPDDQLTQFYILAREMGLSVIIEVHSEDELKRVLPLQARLIGINNRNLQTFETSLETTRGLAGKIPKGVVMISESGIFSRQDVLEVQKAGATAILVGEALMTSPDIPGKIRELLGQ
jgi:indole-3-glycerol phosphate synthase